MCRARSAIVWAAMPVRDARLKIHGPSGKGWTASISPASAASLSVLGVMPRRRADLLRFSQGSMPSSAGLWTGMRWCDRRDVTRSRVQPTGTLTEDNARLILEQAERVSKFR